NPERVSGCFAWLRRMLRCTERQYFGFDGVNVVHSHVEVELLRPLTGRPGRGREVLGLLKRQTQAIDRQDDPVVRGIIDFPAEDTSVKIGERPGVGAVEYYGAHAGEWHREEVCHERATLTAGAVAADALAEAVAATCGWGAVATFSGGSAQSLPRLLGR